VGSIIVGLGYSSNRLRLWPKIVGPLIVIYIVAGGVAGNIKHPIGFFSEFLIWFVGIVVFLPAIWFNFKVGTKSKHEVTIDNK
jgi:hypothetical protein